MVPDNRILYKPGDFTVAAQKMKSLMTPLNFPNFVFLEERQTRPQFLIVGRALRLPWLPFPPFRSLSSSSSPPFPTAQILCLSTSSQILLRLTGCPSYPNPSLPRLTFFSLSILLLGRAAAWLPFALSQGLPGTTPKNAQLPTQV